MTREIEDSKNQMMFSDCDGKAFIAVASEELANRLRKFAGR